MFGGLGRFDDFSHLASLLLEALLLVADNGQIVAANPAAERLFGLPNGELLGQPLAAFVGNHEASSVLRLACRSRTLCQAPFLFR